MEVPAPDRRDELITSRLGVSAPRVLTFFKPFPREVSAPTLSTLLENKLVSGSALRTGWIALGTCSHIETPFALLNFGYLVAGFPL